MVHLDNQAQSKLTRAAVIVFAILALLSTGRQAFVASRLYRQRGPVDIITLNERRFLGLRDVLPPDAVVGFISDKPYPAPFDDPVVYTDLTWAQYAAVPIIIVRDPEQEWILGVSRDPDGIAALSPGPSHRLIEDLGGGVALFRRVP
ncbi:hypothetical protein IIC65_04290 [Candidatus Sumerlaeota bacterium]|nr:hypothetical protein [Candidatus Sumerlaeota bacterium]